ncbi:hypothetical protein VHEMI03725 [[Torrubiella] hemipterigena]|uniref:AB hydrolase-1 domain-containing protein n=1 Tax=[Torrubiella] hemipterigena TaxID=1531966 RepID=A0A0A1STE5_9HYPO|nr:hypothetical protein VHEMI03725 [[Torrubiella] hemipterigena]
MGFHQIAGFAIGILLSPIYIVFLGLGVTPFFQRHFLYAHKINTWWTDLNEPEAWGFAKNQVSPFGLKTTDGETLYAWHILPLPIYLQNEELLVNEPTGYIQDITQATSFRLLKEDPKAKLILYFHGNAGHVAQGIRPDSYHTLTDTSHYHVVAIDYRGYGQSTSYPSEDGLITDAYSLVDWAINTAGVPPRQIVLLGQSLGTAVVSAVAEKCALQSIELGGVVLVAGFSDLANMLSGYRIGGIVPALGPFASMPWFVNLLKRYVVDKWHSANRLGNLVLHTKSRLRLTMIHAKDDWDIPYTEDDKLFKSAAMQTTDLVSDQEFATLKEQRTVHRGKDSFETIWRAEPDIVIRQELYPYGGHNDIMGFAPVSLAIMKCFDDAAK